MYISQRENIRSYGTHERLAYNINRTLRYFLCAYCLVNCYIVSVHLDQGDSTSLSNTTVTVSDLQL